MLNVHYTQLGDFLALHADRIVAGWMEAVKADPRLTTAGSLSEPQLKDHVPKLLVSLVESLKEGGISVNRDAKSNADRHGEQRWQQGYRLREVLLEMFWLRSVLFRETIFFVSGQPNELTLHSEACEWMDRFLNDIESHSVARFVESNKADLYRANQETLRIIRIVSHELRNMLSSVALAFLLLDEGDEEAIAGMRRSLSVNIGQMTVILDDLLDLSNMLTGGYAIKTLPFAVTSFLERLKVHFSPMAESKGLVFTVSADPTLDRICGDELKIRQIIENLVSNAIKFTTIGEVSLRCDAVGEKEFAIVVEDTGVGIAEADRELVFSQSYQVKPESPLRGSGLELWIVARLVKLLNGSIELRSTDKGSLFRVVLPLDSSSGSESGPLHSPASSPPGIE